MVKTEFERDKIQKVERDKMSEFEVKYGSEIDKDILKQIYALDVKVYDEELQGEYINLEERYEFNKDSFICVMKDKTLTGYINFFPVGEKLYDEIFDIHNLEIRDDDIEPHEMAQYSAQKDNHLFIISIVVDPAYRDGETAKLISENFTRFIADKQKNGFSIGSISGAAVSDGGRKFLSRLKFVPRKKLSDGYELYVCDGENLRELIKDGSK